MWDEVVPGSRSPVKLVTVQQADTTAREITRSRVREEVNRHNQSLPEVFCGLVQPEESDRILSSHRPPPPATRSFLGPGRHDAGHSRISHQLSHMLVGVNDDAQIHAVDCGVTALDLDFAP